MVAIQHISKVLSSMMVYSDGMAEAISLSIGSGIPILFHGPGGYNKTEAILAVLRSIDWNWGMLDANPETTASDYFGGAVARTTSDPDGSQITAASLNINCSMLYKDAFFIEETMDATFSANTALKSVITNGGINVNGRWYDSKMIWLVGATNVNPTTFVNSVPIELQNSYNAFLQRFLIVQQDWSEHTKATYLELLNFNPQPYTGRMALSDIIELQSQVSKVKMTKESTHLLASLVAESGKKGKAVSPRNTIWAQRLIKTAAAIDGRKIVSMQDFDVLKYMPAIDETLIESLQKDIHEQMESDKIKKLLNTYANLLTNIENILDTNPKKEAPHVLALTVVATLKRLNEEGDVGMPPLLQLQCPSSLNEEVSKLRQYLFNIMTKANRIASDSFTPIELGLKASSKPETTND